jgi:hypothetical protein
MVTSVPYALKRSVLIDASFPPAQRELLSSVGCLFARSYRVSEEKEGEEGEEEYFGGERGLDDLASEREALEKELLEGFKLGKAKTKVVAKTRRGTTLNDYEALFGWNPYDACTALSRIPNLASEYDFFFRAEFF